MGSDAKNTMKESWVNQHHHRHTLDFFSLSSRWFSKRFKCIFLFVNWHLRESSRDLPQEFSDVYGCRHTWTRGTEFHPLLRRNVEFWGWESGKYLIWWSLWFRPGLYPGLIFVAVFHLPAGGRWPFAGNLEFYPTTVGWVKISRWSRLRI